MHRAARMALQFVVNELTDCRVDADTRPSITTWPDHNLGDQLAEVEVKHGSEPAP